MAHSIYEDLTRQDHRGPQERPSPLDQAVEHMAPASQWTALHRDEQPDPLPGGRRGGLPEPVLDDAGAGEEVQAAALRVPSKSKAFPRASTPHPSAMSRTCNVPSSSLAPSGRGSRKAGIRLPTLRSRTSSGCPGPPGASFAVSHLMGVRIALDLGPPSPRTLLGCPSSTAP